jgi:hypothetical protein
MEASTGASSYKRADVYRLLARECVSLQQYGQAHILKKGEKVMKKVIGIASACCVIAALVATLAFSAFTTRSAHAWNGSGTHYCESHYDPYKCPGQK